MKDLSKFKKQKTFTRAELLEILSRLEFAVGVESFSRVLDVKEELGFDRDENAE